MVAPSARSVEGQAPRLASSAVSGTAKTASRGPSCASRTTGVPAATEDTHVFHAGTTLADDGRLVTSGGRVLCVTALGDSVKLAQQRAYERLSGIAFDGAQYRHDIGHRAIKRDPGDRGAKR